MISILILSNALGNLCIHQALMFSFDKFFVFSRYILLPALLGHFTDKNLKLDRYDTVQKSQVWTAIKLFYLEVDIEHVLKKFILMFE